MRRREFLINAAAACGVPLLPLGADAWATPLPGTSRKRLIVIFLRGAVDGLSVVAPYTEQEYYTSRPTIALPRPGHTGGLFDLDGRFGLHPALASLQPLWKERSLAFVHACGSPDESRSHFDAQAYMELGTPGQKLTADGWMNRLLGTFPGAHPPTEAVNFGNTVPRILEGSLPVASIAPKEDAESSPSDEGTLGEVFDRLYRGNDAMSAAYRQGRAAHTQLMADFGRDIKEAAAGAPSVRGFPLEAEKLCVLMKQDPTIKLAFFGLSGWDTHVSQGAGQGQLANHLKSLGDGLALLRRQLAGAYDETVVVVISEFGRTARENGSGGTDHGHGNVMWVMGGPIAGGKVYGEWPGIDEESLHEGRDLAITTDFRTVIGDVLVGHMGLARDAVPRVFPAGPNEQATRLGLVRT
jgi:uncharacterized protein (DUF1501 family)